MTPAAIQCMAVRCCPQLCTWSMSRHTTRGLLLWASSIARLRAAITCCTVDGDLPSILILPKVTRSPPCQQSANTALLLGKALSGMHCCKYLHNGVSRQLHSKPHSYHNMNRGLAWPRMFTRRSCAASACCHRTACKAGPAYPVFCALKLACLHWHQVQTAGDSGHCHEVR